MFPQDLIIKKEAKQMRLLFSEGTFDITGLTNTPAVILIFPDTSEISDAAYLSLCAALDSKDSADIKAIIDKTLIGKSLTQDDKDTILTQYSQKYTDAGKYGYPWLQGAEKADYPLTFRRTKPYQNLGDIKDSILTELIRKDKLELASQLTKTLDNPDIQNILSATNNKVNMTELADFYTKGWFDAPENTLDTRDILRFNTEHIKSLKIGLGNSDKPGTMSISLSEDTDTKPHKISNITSIQINDDIKLSKVAEIVILPLKKDESVLSLSEGTDTLITETIKGIEVCAPGIFKKGTPQEVEFTNEDMHKIVKSFHELKNQIKPPLRQWKPQIKLGHTPTVRPANDGLPSFGWVTDLYVDNNTGVVKADLENVPAKIANLMKVSAFRRVSPEFKYSKSEAGISNIYLTALALLGADIPEIKSLKDITNLYRPADNSEILIACSEDSNLTDVSILPSYLADDTRDKQTDMTLEMLGAITAYLQSLDNLVTGNTDETVDIYAAVDSLLTRVQDRIKSLTDGYTNRLSNTDISGGKNMEELFKYLFSLYSEMEDVKGMEYSPENLEKLKSINSKELKEAKDLQTSTQAELAELKQNLETLQKEKQDQTIEAKFSELSTAGKLEPAMKPKFKALAEKIFSTTVTFSEDGSADKESEIQAMDLLTSMFSGRATHVAFSEGLPAGEAMSSQDQTVNSYAEGCKAADAALKSRGQFVPPKAD